MISIRKTFWLLVFAVACDRGPATAPPPATSTSTSTSTSTATSASTTPAAPTSSAAPRVAFLERTTAGAAATDELPMIVAIHGMGDRPETWVATYDAFPVRARVVFPRALLPFSGGGWSWFHYPPSSIDELAHGVADAADAVAELLTFLPRSRRTRGKPIVTGFSQGGFLSFAVAARHPELVDAAFPVSGGLPPSLWPASVPDGAPAPPIFAIHGDADRLVPIAPAREAVAHLRAIGWPAELREYPGIPHKFNEAMHQDVLQRIAARLGAPVKGSSR